MTTRSNTKPYNGNNCDSTRLFMPRNGIILVSIVLLFASYACTDHPEPPNILFAIADDQSFPHAGAYGCDWVSTPSFDEIAKNGVLFMNCYTPNAKCAPSRSAIITGRNSWQLEAAGNHVSIFPKKFKSVCEALDEQTDYHVGFTGKGVEPVNPQGRFLTGKKYNGEKLIPPGKSISTTDYTENFRKFLDENKDGKPFFFWYGGHEPHRAYDYNIGIKKGGKKLEDIDVVPDFWPDNELVRTDMLDYAYEIEYFDKHLGNMIQMLDERGMLENTIVIVTADNGMPFPRCKGIEYEYSNHMPLAIMWPKGLKNPGRKIEDYVSFIDLAPTFLELAGVTDLIASGMSPIEGKSLLSMLKSEKEGQIMPDRNYVLLGQERHDVGRPDDVGYPIRSILQERILYIHNFKPDRWPMCNPETGYLNTDGSPTKSIILDLHRSGENSKFWDLCFDKHGSEELYNVVADPECLNNLIDEPEFIDLINELRTKLFTELKTQDDPRMYGKGHLFDEYPYAQELHRNFYNRYMAGEITNFITTWVNESDFEKEQVISK